MTGAVAVGVDGGGTKTAALVMDMDGETLGRGASGSSNWNSVGRDRAQDHLLEAIDSALADAALDRDAIGALVVCSAGVDRPADKRRIDSWLQAVAPQAARAVHNDAVAALASGTGGELYGVVLVSGTGMIVYGYDRTGASARAGGWGALLGDPGSGYDVAIEALRAVTRAVDGRGSQTLLTSAILSHLHLAQPSDLIDWAYADMAWERFARLAPVVIDCAAAGDPVAREVIDGGARGLAVAVQAVASTLDLVDKRFPLVLAGGTLQKGLYADRVISAVRGFAPRVKTIHPRVEPVAGAALLARQMLEG